MQPIGKSRVAHGQSTGNHVGTEQMGCKKIKNCINFEKKDKIVLIKYIKMKRGVILKKENKKNKMKFIIFIILTSLLIMYLTIFIDLNTTKAAAGSDVSDVQLLARAINGEARGESYEGQVAVGAVILNRVKSSKFPNTIAGVIYQPGAFTAVDDGQINVPIEEGSTVLKAARDALNGWDPTNGAIYYFNPDTATSDWIWSRPLIKTIGKHRFCR